MRKTIMVVSATPDECRDLCRFLERSHFLAIPLETLSDLVNRLAATHCNALILDLDSLPVDNRFICKISKEHPEVRLIGVSSRNFHPELEEAMRTHISACLSKPVNEDELLFWLKSLCGGDSSPRASPSAG